MNWEMSLNSESEKKWTCTVKGPEENKEQQQQKNPEPFSQAARCGVKILSDQVHIIGLVNIHSFLRYSEG